MRSIKPGRGPSALNTIGGVIGIVFGIFWTILAFTITRNAPFPLVGIVFPLFGVLFVILGIVRTCYDARNASAKNRYSEYDLTSPEEEPDPLNQRFGRPATRHTEESVEARLQKLNALRQKGIISDAEFAEQRKRILNKI
jgi:hypothetical protein